MTTSDECDVCHMPGMMCSHRAGLGRAMAMFSREEARQSPNGLHEFQFFGRGGADSWLVNGPRFGVAAVSEDAVPSEPGFRYVDFLRNTCEPGRLTLDATSSSTPAISSDSTSRSPAKEATTVGKISFSSDGAVTTNSPDMTVKEANKAAVGMECEANAMDREARVLRYREKKKRRKFEKQIRYASRKAYAETRPRVKGRFAKVPAEVTTQRPHQLDMGWYQYQHQP